MNGTRLVDYALIAIADHSKDRDYVHRSTDGKEDDLCNIMSTTLVWSMNPFRVISQCGCENINSLPPQTR